MKYTVYMDGEFLLQDDLFVESLTPGIFEGRGVFETIRVQDNQPCFLDRHLSRLRQGLKILNMRLAFTVDQIQSVVHKMFVFNQFKSARLRILVYKKNRGVGFAMAMLPREEISEQDYFNGYHVTSASSPGRSAKFASVKSLDYARYRELARQAKQKGFDEVLLINPQGYVFEASRSNVFFIKSGVLYTPTLTLGGLNGITRGVVIECAREMNMPLKQVKPNIKDIVASDEIFVTGAITGVMPVTKFDHKIIPSGRIGDRTHQIRLRYLKKRDASAAMPPAKGR